MNKRDTHAFINQLLVYTLVTICFSGSVGLGTVWLRHQISVTANRTKILQSRIAEVERHLAEMTAAVETEQRPEMLHRLNREWSLGLERPNERRVVRVAQDVRVNLASKRHRDLFPDSAVAPVTFQFAATR